MITVSIVMPVYNGARFISDAINSLRKQTFTSWSLLISDNASEDETSGIVQAYIDEYNLQDKITFIRNNVRCRKVRNEYLAFHLCKDNEIIVQLDGDDWFAHDRVFSNLNHEYLTNNIWLTYGTHKNFPLSNMGAKSSPTPLRITKKRHFRYNFRYMPIRSFYAWLVKLIKLEDFINDDVPEFKGKF